MKKRDIYNHETQNRYIVTVKNLLTGFSSCKNEYISHIFTNFLYPPPIYDLYTTFLDMHSIKHFQKF